MNNLPKIVNRFFPDTRIAKRCNLIINSMMLKPEKSITAITDSVPESRAVFRLLASTSFGFTKLLEGYIHSVTKMIRIRFKTLNSKRLLIVQDTSDIDLSGLKSTKDKLGYLPNSKCNLKTFGLSIHSGLAVTTDGEPVGLLHQESIIRNINDLGKSKDRNKKPIEEKESYKWLKCIKRVLELGIKKQLIFVGDRENDINDIFLFHKESLLNEDTSSHFDLVVRARHTRKVNIFNDLTNKSESIIIDEYIREHSKLNLKGSIVICRSQKQEEKEIDVNIYSSEVKLNKLRSGKGNTRDYSEIKLNTVMVENKSEKIRWILFTTLDLLTTQDILNVVQYYKHRWLIERFHYTLKSGCGLEDIQLKNIESIQKAIILHSITACQILRLTILSRIEPEAHCTKMFSRDEWEAIYLATNKTNKLPKNTPTLGEITLLLAKLGGFKLWHKTDIPGVKSIWWGIQALDQLLKIYPRLVVRG
jgi:Transposase Tn5 dimerisation domain